jgi:hypothetical protein
MHASPLATPATPATRSRLRIGVVGGVDRTAVLLERALARIGCDLEHHTGHMAGRGAAGLAALIDRVDLVVILTDVNSHNAVLAARKLAAARGRRHLLMRRCSPSSLVRQVSVMTDLRPS